MDESKLLCMLPWNCREAHSDDKAKWSSAVTTGGPQIQRCLHLAMSSIFDGGTIQLLTAASNFTILSSVERLGDRTLLTYQQAQDPKNKNDVMQDASPRN
jgi:hypothetical protein